MDQDRSLRRLSPPRREKRLEARAARDKADAAKPKPAAEPVPKPAAIGSQHPSAEEFEAWCKDPVTRFVALSYALSAALNEAAWHQMSWVQMNPEESRLIEFKARADAYKAFCEVGHARYVEIVNVNSKGPKK